MLASFRRSMELLFELAFLAGLVGFGIWFTVLTGRMNRTLNDINDSQDQLDQIEEGIRIVAEILNKLPELMPQFTMNTNPLQPIFEAFARKIGGESLITYETPRNSEGQFDATETQWKENPPQ